MKKILLFLVLSQFMLINSQEKVIKDLKISRVIVQTRIFKGDQTVKNIQLKDLELFEDNQRQKIDQLIPIASKIGLHKISLSSQNNLSTKSNEMVFYRFNKLQ